jgi:hypothetical protein
MVIIGQFSAQVTGVDKPHVNEILEAMQAENPWWLLMKFVEVPTTP